MARKKKVLMIGPLPKGVNVRPRQKRSRKRNRRRGKKMGGNGDSMVAAHAICSNYNPFCEVASNAKLFDENSAPSSTYSSKQMISIATDAAGQAYYAFTPRPQNGNAKATIVANLVTAWTLGTNTPFYTLLGSTVVKNFRVVSWGIKFYTTQAWTDAIGNVIISETTDYAQQYLGQDVTSLNNGQRVKAMALRDAEAYCVGRPLGKLAEDYQTSLTGWGGHSNFTIAIDGGKASSTIGTAEIIINYEWQAISNTGYVLLASKAAPDMPVVLKGRSDVAANTDPIIQSKGPAAVDEHFLDKALNYVNSGLNFANKLGDTYQRMQDSYKRLGPMTNLSRIGNH